MDSPSIFDAEDEVDQLEITKANVTSHPEPHHGGILVLDKHITYASLHRPLFTWFRRDVVPFALVLLTLFLLAAPALWYETQVSWIRSGEEVIEANEIEVDPVAAAAAILNEDLDDSRVDANSTSTTNTTKPLSEIDLLVQAVPVPENYHFYFMYLLPLYLFLSAIMWLVLYWNVCLQILTRYSDEGSIEAAGSKGRATHVRVVPVEHGGKSEICELKRTIIAPEPGSVSSTPTSEIYFLFQKTKYILHESGVAAPAGHVNAWFAPLDFPTHDSIQSYIDHANRAGSVNETTALTRKYGPNTFDIPLPPFMDLFKEHALAPFFVFQIFCVLLWCLDEYWYYSLVTLFMLVMFEATVVKRRLKNLEFLREMRIQAYQVHVYRGGKWIQISTSDLIPHDLISLVRPEKDQILIPADILLLTGSVVVNESMLTGESIPQVKENIESNVDSLEITLEMNKAHKRNILFGGTKIVLANTPTQAETELSKLNIKPPPGGGCIGYVLRTGFNTSQGKLVRTILFSSESVSINNTESLLFIGVLLIFALVASAYVCMKGLEDENRSRYKLMLNCIMIITSVVPPELPMELSLAVNTSLLALMRQNIFCTEPFRIPLAGAVDICCFDKTGTLTADEFIVKGIAGIPKSATGKDSVVPPVDSTANSISSVENTDPNLIHSSADLPLSTKYIIAGCNSLTFLPDVNHSHDDTRGGDDHLIGDPLEKSSLQFIEWTLGRNETSLSKNGGRERLRIIHKYPFSSALKRMATIVAQEHIPGSNLKFVMKGAAEVMESMFSAASIPANYTQLHTTYSQQGCRVLALGWKDLNDFKDLPDDRKRLKSLTRESLETELQFGGFLILQCPLKKDSYEVIQQLKQSTHQIMMITGDHILTANSVARELGITVKQTIILQLQHDSNTNLSSSVKSSSTPAGTLVWQKNSLTDNSSFPFTLDYTEATITKLSDEYDLCISGDALEYLTHYFQEKSKSAGIKSSSVAMAPLALLVAYTKVFARTSPDQKELILHWLKSRGLTTLMCGDGTNDVGALKQAHIGVALIGEDAAKAIKNKQAQMAQKKKDALTKSAGSQVKSAAEIKEEKIQKIKAAQAAATSGGAVVAGQPPKTKLQQQLAEQMAKMEAEMAMEENTTPRLGDASIASPFTSKLPFITSCVDIIRQGRCTLVTTLQMFNILGINCLISAYSMSVLYLDGVKWGDTQMTIASLSIAAFFFCISRSQPLKQLSAERPHKNLFTFSMILSVLGQFAIHMMVLLTAINSANPHTPTTDEHKNPEKTFKPNVLNTVVYLVSTTQTVATFAANYRGRPFMESLTENTALYKSLTFTLGLMFLLASELLPSLNTFLELHALPSADFRSELIMLMIIDVTSTWFYAKFIRRVFAVKPTTEQIKAAGLLTKKEKETATAIHLALKKHQ